MIILHRHYLATVIVWKLPFKINYVLNNTIVLNWSKFCAGKKERMAAFVDTSVANMFVSDCVRYSS